MEKQLQLVSFEQAKKLKELGFDWKCFWYYDPDFSQKENKALCYGIETDHNSTKNVCISAPEIALALKWFRDVKRMPNSVNFWDVVSYEYVGSFQIQTIIKKEGKTYVPRTRYTSKSCNAYEAAESALLDELLILLEKEI